MIVTAIFGGVGFVDDYRKVVEKNSKGLSAKWKMFWQSLGGLGAAIFLYQSAVDPVEVTLYFPFFKNLALDMGLFYVVFTYFVIVGSSNAVNLTDGLDGLAIMPSVMVASALGVQV